MRLTVAGCSGSGPGRDGAASCYLVEAGSTRIVLDVGPGSLSPLQRHVRLADVDAVLLSHLHPDHCLDLCAWHVAAKYGDAGRAGTLRAVASTGAAERMARAYGVERPERLDTMTFEAWTPELNVGDVRVTAVRAAHPGESWSMRLEHEGRSLVFSGDTGPNPRLQELAAGCNLLLCEAAAEEPLPGLHLTGAEAGELAAAAGAGRLVLTHIPTWTDPADALEQARGAYGGEVVLAASGGVHEV
ncbi:ribonuclease BN (tRNA processing enzyme) [Motilibacter peucedani]|uniref:Ribonuclease BN (tRNA processing enzyme) n=1 Tax=Motilibacter peucedani TaxID=598650 RepID=A0A420XNC1_9ACTN|nr:MBL fold metallo-hydrolase [Motilibacter peucedani]RKS72765.1 ribonuclease BN (tRNA processing enzyme) [Motilibacter peucedani]